jgi:hypothetical protein
MAPEFPSSSLVDADKCPVPGADDIYAMHVYVSTSSGGPYTQVNLSPIVSSGKMHFTVGGLVNGATYYVVAKYQDYAGNLSPYSTQVSVTPHP